MPKVGVNNEPLLERLVFAYDGTDYRVVKCDTNGNVVAALAADQNVQARLHGYDGSAWRKLPLILGRSALWDENLGGTATGTNYIVGSTTVPAGWLFVLSSASIRNNTRNVTSCAFTVKRASGAAVFLAFAATLAQYVPMVVTGQFVLEAGDYLEVSIFSTVTGDAVESGITGYKMQINA